MRTTEKSADAQTPDFGIHPKFNRVSTVNLLSEMFSISAKNYYSAHENIRINQVEIWIVIVKLLFVIKIPPRNMKFLHDNTQVNEFDLAKNSSSMKYQICCTIDWWDDDVVEVVICWQWWVEVSMISTFV